jgi:glycosyltransferase involved in cell wall biosynthesis
MNKPLVSVIIPAYNGAAYLAEAIQSILNQTYRPLEILVVDNASQDQTAQIAQSFSLVRYIYLKQADTSLARNEGIAKAQGTLLAFLDQDDIWTPDKLAKQVAFLEKNPSVSGTVCQQKMVLQPGHQKPHWLKREFLETAQPAYLPSALLVRRTALEQTDLFDPTYSLSSDVAWFFKAKHSGMEIILLPEVLLQRRIHSDNASNRCAQIHKEILSVIQSSLQERRKKVSIIIAVYNGEKYLREAIESALTQDYKNKEILIVNDGSTDSTQTIVESFRSQIRSIEQSNQGLGAARNTGVRAATGEYFAFLDHDDFWETTKLSDQMAFINGEDALLFGHVKQFICPTLTAEESRRLSVNEEIVPGYFAGTLLVSKKRFLQIGPFFEKKSVGEFVDWYARALEAKVPILLLPKLVLHRRVHNHNMGRQKEDYNRLEYLKILKNSLDRRRKSHATSP